MNQGKKLHVDMIAFRRDVEDGTPVLTLAEKYGVSKATVFKWRTELSSAIARRRQPAEDEAEVENPDAFYNVTLTVPTERLDDIIADFADHEIRAAVADLPSLAKATIFESVMQRRLDNALEPLAVPLTGMVPA